MSEKTNTLTLFTKKDKTERNSQITFALPPVGCQFITHMTVTFNQLLVICSTDLFTSTVEMTTVCYCCKPNMSPASKLYIVQTMLTQAVSLVFSKIKPSQTLTKKWAFQVHTFMLTPSIVQKTFIYIWIRPSIYSTLDRPGRTQSTHLYSCGHHYVAQTQCCKNSWNFLQYSSSDDHNDYHSFHIHQHLVRVVFH